MSISVNKPLVVAQNQTVQILDIGISFRGSEVNGKLSFRVFNEDGVIVKEPVIVLSGAEWDAFWKNWSTGASVYEVLNLKEGYEADIPTTIENDFINVKEGK